ncbi:hypothetical protein AB205_0097410 [Aquarana catesbeiana]|uniref:Uncharacterized protein n=1 Tax=Aquarana catesbeiana TaxID=8400 RepID=A0A2G9SJJ5_AQUCT|nr:hypothetical protein AB205_0097410 [Aquarana catesbeiana]
MPPLISGKMVGFLYVLISLHVGYKGLRCHRVYQKLLVELKIQEKQKREEEEREREREREQEQERARLRELEAQKSAMRPVPIPRKRLPPVWIKSEDASMEPPVPRPRSTLIQLSPFDNAIHRVPSVKSEEGEKRQIQRRKTIVWFRETQAKKVLDDGEFPPWLYGMTSRR